MLRHPLRYLAAALLCLAATPAVGQNLIKNGRFNTDTSFWNLAYARIPNDADGWPGSGSLQISNSIANPNVGLAVAQCVPVQPGQLLIRAKAFIPSGQSRTGYATAWVYAYNAADCTGPQLANKTIGTSAATGNWVTIESSFTPPPGAAAVKMFFSIVKSEGGGTLIGLLDDVFLGAPCALSSTNLCLGNHRFGVTAHWTTAQGSGEGVEIPLSGDTGYYWFFSPGNVEAVLKVINGCPVNGRYWVFAGGLTNVKVDLTVTDYETGAVKTYSNPQGKPFQPIQDTGAFVTCP